MKTMTACDNGFTLQGHFAGVCQTKYNHKYMVVMRGSIARVRGRLFYLAKTAAFQERPILTLARSLMWLGCSKTGRSPQFTLFPGARFRVDSGLDHSGATSAFVLRDWAEPELRFLHMLVSAGDTFIDCGANMGAYTVKASVLVGSLGRVIAVEPGEKSHELLTTNISINNSKNVTVVKQAISDRSAWSRLYHSDGGPASYSLVHQEGTSFEAVRTTTIDELVQEHGLRRVDCIKMDVEGFEHAALKGASKTLKAHRPTVIFEIVSPGLRRSGASIDAVPRLLRDFGYHFYQIRKGRLCDADADLHNIATMVSPNCVAIHETKQPKR